eukprot:8258359-Pyramimonas_sp.AAC.1
MDELSRGLHDETACVTFRDQATDFLLPLRVYATNGARELARACYELKIAHDPSIPGNKKHNAVAERANGV